MDHRLSPSGPAIDAENVYHFYGSIPDDTEPEAPTATVNMLQSPLGQDAIVAPGERPLLIRRVVLTTSWSSGPITGSGIFELVKRSTPFPAVTVLPDSVAIAEPSPAPEPFVAPRFASGAIIDLPRTPDYVIEPGGVDWIHPRVRVVALTNVPISVNAYIYASPI